MSESKKLPKKFKYVSDDAFVANCLCCNKDFWAEGGFGTPPDSVYVCNKCYNAWSCGVKWGAMHIIIEEEEEIDEDNEADEFDMKILGFKTTERIDGEWHSLLWDIRNHGEEEEWVKECLYCRKEVKEKDWYECEKHNEEWEVFKISCKDCYDKSIDVENLC